MALWFKRKTKDERVLEFNRKKLSEEMQNLSEKLYDVRNDISFAIIVELIHMAANVAVLEHNQETSEFCRGRRTAFMDLANYLENAVDASHRKQREEKKEQVRSTIQMVGRRTSNQAGAAI